MNALTLDEILNELYNAEAAFMCCLAGAFLVQRSNSKLLLRNAEVRFLGRDLYENLSVSLKEEHYLIPSKNQMYVPMRDYLPLEDDVGLDIISVKILEAGCKDLLTTVEDKISNYVDKATCKSEDWYWVLNALRNAAAHNWKFVWKAEHPIAKRLATSAIQWRRLKITESDNGKNINRADKFDFSDAFILVDDVIKYFESITENKIKTSQNVSQEEVIT